MHFAIELIKLGLEFMQHAKVRIHKPGFYEDNAFRSLMIYNIKEIQPGLWLPLNRDYNVLGVPANGRYEEHTSSIYNHMLIKAEDINFDVLKSSGNGTGFYTFSDSTYPAIFYKNIYKKNYIRYKRVIETAFFGRNTITFSDAWH